MNFYERQEAARRGSTRLVVLFVLAVLGIVAAVDLAVLFLLGGGERSGTLLAFTTLFTAAVIGLGSLYRIASLRGGGDAVAVQMGGVPVPEDTTDFALRRLRNVVEEMAIASGVPVPRIYVLEHEAGINAFAAGYTPADAAIAVTRGALQRLNRDELQGVVAHEFSHILNGDMRLNLRLIGVLFGILMLGLIGRKILEHGRGARGRSGGAVLMVALVAMVVGYIGLFFGRMIKAGVSRTRERLADASAVQFTRQAQGLAGALKKIVGLAEGSRLSERGEAEEVSHMLFGDGIGLSGLFATHPPLLERIQALEPGFRPDQLETLSRRWAATPPDGLEEDLQLGLATREAAHVPLPGAGSAVALSPSAVAMQVAQPSPHDYQRADAIVAALPEPLRALARDRAQVVPLLLALLLDEDPALAARQLGEIATRLGPAVAEQARASRAGPLAGLHPALCLPLAELAFPALRQRPRPELEAFLDSVHAVAHADGRVSLFEYCLAQLLRVQVREALDPARYARFGRRRLTQVRGEVAALLGVVAQSGHDDPAEAQRAYLAGLQHVLPQEHLPYLPPDSSVQALDAVWAPLDALDPLAKQSLVEALAATVAHDGRVNVVEAELLRTVCAVLHCPLPPVLERG